MDLAPDFNEFIASLNAQGVEFLIVGAYALAFHGAPRFTGDLDILVRPTSDNAAKVLAAVRAFGFPVDTLTPTDLTFGNGCFRSQTNSRRCLPSASVGSRLNLTLATSLRSEVATLNVV